MIRVTCAIIRNEENEVLVVQRGEKSDHPFKWEFPGGKINPGESEEECLIREIKEELSIDIVICNRMQDVDHDYGKKHILLIPFICDTLEEIPFLSEHIAYDWIAPAGLKKVDFSGADIIVAENYLECATGSESKNGLPSPASTLATDDEDLRAMVTKMMGLKNAEWVATSAIDNPAIFSKLVDYSYSDDKKLAFHASWILSKVCDKFPEFIYPYLPGVIEALKKLDNESAKRSFLRIISLTDFNKISNKHHGILVDNCFSELKSGFSAVAIKAYSMEILYKLALIYPELANELSVTINMLQGEGSAGIVARGRIILKQLAGISGNQNSRKPGK
jgi:8-oxo-dGTP diphosphatase